MNNYSGTTDDSLLLLENSSQIILQDSFENEMVVNDTKRSFLQEAIEWTDRIETEKERLTDLAAQETADFLNEPFTRVNHQNAQTIESDLQFYQYGLEVRYLPLFRALQVSPKFVSTTVWLHARRELQFSKMFDRFCELRRLYKNSSTQTASLDLAQSVSKKVRSKKRPAPESFLPMTHWDFLLQESQWMALDFRQEARWKQRLAHQIAVEAVDYLRQRKKCRKRELLDSPLFIQKETVSLAIYSKEVPILALPSIDGSKRRQGRLAEETKDLPPVLLTKRPNDLVITENFISSILKKYLVLDTAIVENSKFANFSQSFGLKREVSFDLLQKQYQRSMQYHQASNSKIVLPRAITTKRLSFTAHPSHDVAVRKATLNISKMLTPAELAQRRVVQRGSNTVTASGASANSNNLSSPRPPARLPGTAPLPGYPSQAPQQQQPLTPLFQQAMQQMQMASAIQRPPILQQARPPPPPPPPSSTQISQPQPSNSTPTTSLASPQILHPIVPSNMPSQVPQPILMTSASAMAMAQQSLQRQALLNRTQSMGNFLGMIGAAGLSRAPGQSSIVPSQQQQQQQKSPVKSAETKSDPSSLKKSQAASSNANAPIVASPKKSLPQQQQQQQNITVAEPPKADLSQPVEDPPPAPVPIVQPTPSPSRRQSMRRHQQQHH